MFYYTEFYTDSFLPEVLANPPHWMMKRPPAALACDLGCESKYYATACDYKVQLYF